MKTTYISIDLETTGPLPGVNTLLSLGAAAFTLEDGMLDTYEVNFEVLPGDRNDRETMEFWGKWPEAYAATRENTKLPQTAILEFVEWFEKFENPVFVFYPTKFDGTFLYYYLYKFAGMSFTDSPDCIDIKTYALCFLNETSTTKAGKRDWPKRWKTKKRHKHVAISDAIEQGESWMKMLKDRIGLNQASSLINT
jgi:DNA polymerase III alpha subunit (gram-positive type)